MLHDQETPDLLGTGTTLFNHTLMENVKIQNEIFFKNMADLLLLRQAKRFNYKLITITRNFNWLKDLGGAENIYASSTNNLSNDMNTVYKQTGYINNHLKIPKGMNYALMH